MTTNKKRIKKLVQQLNDELKLVQQLNDELDKAKKDGRIPSIGVRRDFGKPGVITSVQLRHPDWWTDGFEEKDEVV